MSGVTFAAASPNWVGLVIPVTSAGIQVFSSTNLKKIREITNASTTGAMVFIAPSSTAGVTTGLGAHGIPAANPFRLALPMMAGNIWAYTKAGETGVITAFSC